MAQIEIITEKNQDSTCIVFSGKVSAAEIVASLKNFYALEITSNILWDFSDCDISAIVPDDLGWLIKNAKKYAHLRVDGKSALVGKCDFNYGLGRMYSSLSEVHDNPILTRTFRTVDEAIAWLST